MQIPGIYTDIHISFDTVRRLHDMYIWNVPRFLHSHSLKSAYLFGLFAQSSTVQPIPGQQLLSSQADPPERLFGSMIGRDRGGVPGDVGCGKRPLELGCPHVGGKAPFPSKQTTWHVMIMEKVTVSGMGSHPNFERMLDFLDEMALFFQF